MFLAIEEIEEKIRVLTKLGVTLLKEEIDKLYTCKNYIQLENVSLDIMNRQWDKKFIDEHTCASGKRFL